MFHATMRKKETMSVGEECVPKIMEAVVGFPVEASKAYGKKLASIIDRIVAERGSTNSVANSSKLVGEPAGASQPQDQPSAETGLAPCPFCGGNQVDVENNRSGNEWACCETCVAEGPVAKSYYEAIAKWNKRAASNLHAQQTPAVARENQNDL